MASMVAVTAQNRRSLSRKTVFSASDVVAETRWDTKTTRSLSSRCWDRFSPVNWLCSLTNLARATDGSRSLKRVDKIDGEQAEGCPYFYR